MINHSPLDALELLLKGTVTCHTKDLLLSRLKEGQAAERWVKRFSERLVTDPRLDLALRPGTDLLVRVGKLKLQRWVVP